MTVVALLGSTGFIGSAVAAAVRARGAEVLPVRAPRMSTSARTVEELEAQAANEDGAALADALAGADVVVNAAGIADATAGGEDALFGANALLPVVIARALAGCERPARLVHVSSAAVQGRTGRLDESPTVAPFSPYSASKALAEQAVLGRPGVVIFRPTSVHGRQRVVTQRLVGVLRSRFASVAGRGSRPTPQVLVANTADAVAFTALAADPPAIVLQPGEGLTTADLVRVVGGREPRHVPGPIARAVVAALALGGDRLPRLTVTGRRLEMMWFGQEQASGWLDAAGWRPVVGIEGWEQLT